MLMIDLIITIDSLFLKDDESAKDVVDYIKERWQTGYEPIYEVTYEETVDD